ncbi:MAG: D-alanyl-D-alanine carboxypeptidase family protein [Chitinophagales bacterium]
MKKYLLKMILFLTVLAGVINGGGQAWAKPEVAAKAYVLVDNNTGQVLACRNARERMYPASTTKIMTGLLALEYLDPDLKATVSRKADHTPGTAIGLKEGQEVRVRDLVNACLMSSANDASVVLAEKVGGSEQVFSYLMNKKALILGADSTQFVNSNGLTSRNHYTTCYDMYLITRYAMSNNSFASITGKKTETIGHPSYPQGLVINNTNRLLQYYNGACGVKTGTTNAAGNCLVAMASRGKKSLISVVLKAGDRYAASETLLNYGFNMSRKRVVCHSQVFKILRVKEGERLKVSVYPDRNIWLWVGKNDECLVEKKVRLKYFPEAPIEKGDKLGNIEVYYNGELVETAGIKSKDEIARESKGIWRLIWR